MQSFQKSRTSLVKQKRDTSLCVVSAGWILKRRITPKSALANAQDLSNGSISNVSSNGSKIRCRLKTLIPITRFLGNNLNANSAYTTLLMLLNTWIRYGPWQTFIALRIKMFPTSFLKAQTSRKTHRESSILPSLVTHLKSSHQEEDTRAIFELMTLVFQDFMRILYTKMTSSYSLIAGQNLVLSLYIMGIQCQTKTPQKLFKQEELWSLCTQRIPLLGITKKSPLIIKSTLASYSKRFQINDRIKLASKTS